MTEWSIMLTPPGIWNAVPIAGDTLVDWIAAALDQLNRKEERQTIRKMAFLRALDNLK